MKNEAPPKGQYKETIQTKISAYYENSLRTMAENNSKMEYLIYKRAENNYSKNGTAETR